MAGKKEPKAVKALIAKHEKTQQAKQVIPAATLWHRLRLRKKK